MTTQVKICGIQRLDHALATAQAGADYIGLNFVPERHRRIEAATAREIVSRLKSLEGNVPQVVGLFADQPVEEVNEIVETCGLDLVQLCGSESLDYCRRIRSMVIKVLHVPLSANAARPDMPSRMVQCPRRPARW